MTTSTNDREAWLTLALTPGVGTARFHALLKAFGSPDGAHSAPFAFLCAVPGISRACATAIKEGAKQRWGAAALEAVDKLGARVLAYTDPDFPESLKEIADPPMVLFAWGRVELLTGANATSAPAPERPGAAAIVGTRHPTQYGVDVTASAARGCAESFDGVEHRCAPPTLRLRADRGRAGAGDPGHGA